MKSNRASRQRSLVAGTGLPDWLGSVRFRLALIYSLLLFGLAAIVVGIIYLAVLRSVSGQPITEGREAVIERAKQSGQVLTESELEEIDALVLFEKRVNQRTLENLRRYSFTALGLLFVGSLGVGWLVAGRVLAPIERIRRVAEDIRATDLKRRIALEGPDDELKQLADTFDDMIRRLDVAFESQRRFIQEASHELRNPLAVIRTNVEVALADESTTAAELRDAAEVVRRAADRMGTLVDDLVLYARHERPELGREPVNLATVAADAVADFTAPAEARGLRIRADIEDPVWVTGDRVAIQRAVANLAANAVRLAPDGTTVTVGTANGGGDACIWVRDEGPGISPELHADVFQRFWRGTTEGGRGRSGLGLTIVRQIAESHGGRVDLESASDSGSTFTIVLRPDRPPADISS